MIDLNTVELINYVIHESYSSLIFKIKVEGEVKDISLDPDGDIDQIIELINKSIDLTEDNILNKILQTELDISELNDLNHVSKLSIKNFDKNIDLSIFINNNFFYINFDTGSFNIYTKTLQVSPKICYLINNLIRL
jgi:spore coat protein CotH